MVIAVALILVTVAMLGNALVLLRVIRSLERQREQRQAPPTPARRGVLGNALVLLRVIRSLERQRNQGRPERQERPVLLAWPRDDHAHRPRKRVGFIPDRSVERPRAVGELG